MPPCNSAILTGISGDYPQNGTDYVIFSNEEAVRAKAAELKKQKESGNPVDAEEIISQLANIIVCLQPRVEATQSAVTSAVDKVIVNNPKNVQTNLFLVEQTPSAERIDSFTDESTGFNPYSSWNNNFCFIKCILTLFGNTPFSLPEILIFEPAAYT